MPNHNMVIDTLVPPLAAELSETFFFGMSLLDTLTRTETGDSRGVHGIVCLFDIFHAVSIRTSCLLFPILTRVQGAKGCQIAQEMLC